MIGYVRPPLVVEEFHDDNGSVIAYGTRWAHVDWDGPEDTYSVTRHPDRFQPFVDVAHVIVKHLMATYDVQRENPEERTVVLRPLRSDAAPLTFVFDSTPMVNVTAGLSSSIAWFCSCDHCDEDVTVAIETLEQEVSAVVNGGLREWLNDPAQGHLGDDLFVASSLQSIDGEIDQSSSSGVDNEARRQELRTAYADVPPKWTAWTLRRR